MGRFIQRVIRSNNILKGIIELFRYFDITTECCYDVCAYWDTETTTERAIRLTLTISYCPDDNIWTNTRLNFAEYTQAVSACLERLQARQGHSLLVENNVVA